MTTIELKSSPLPSTVNKYHHDSTIMTPPFQQYSHAFPKKSPALRTHPNIHVKTFSTWQIDMNVFINIWDGVCMSACLCYIYSKYKLIFRKSIRNVGILLQPSKPADSEGTREEKLLFRTRPTKRHSGWSLLAPSEWIFFTKWFLFRLTPCWSFVAGGA